MTDIVRYLESNIINASAKEKTIFISLFKELYKISLFKDGLDLILTRCEQGLVTFDLNITKEFEELRGCCLTQEKYVYHKLFKTFFKQHEHKITIKKLDVDVIMHEIAHALEKETGLDIRKGFLFAIQKDLRNINTHINIRNAVEQVIYKEIKLYKEEQYGSEFLARYFQLIAMSYEVGSFDSNFHFKSSEILTLFRNTTNWIHAIFNANLKSKIPDHIAAITHNITFDEEHKKNANKIHKLHENSSVKWSKVIKPKL